MPKLSRTSLLLMAAIVSLSACREDSAKRARAVIAVDPQVLDFGGHTAGSQVTLPVSLSNTGNATLHLSASIINDARSAFSIDGVPDTIEPGANATVNVTYRAPATEGPDGASIDIESDAENAAQLQVTLGGRSTLACPGQTLCGNACVDTGTDTANCGSCGHACGTAEVCEAGACKCPNTCATLGKNCGAVPNGCGGMLDCGTCNTPESCGGAGTANVCGCTPENDTQFCSRIGVNCGEVTDWDNCDVNRTVNCGSCTLPETCGGGALPNVCGCTPATDAEFCSDGGANCGQLSGTDNCGAMRTVDCGTCSGAETCGGGGTSNVCGCTPDSDAAICAAAGKNCGTFAITDNCGAMRTVSCGTCNAPETCGGAGVTNVCGCTPDPDATICSAAGKNCGTMTVTDNCNASRQVSCGSCTAPQTCGGGGTANVCACAPETNAAFCTRLGKNCGTVTDLDNCGQQRSVSCGSCNSPETCGGTGNANVCGCAPETNQSFCQRLATGCGPITGTDNCGQTRALNSCSNIWISRANMPITHAGSGWGAVGNVITIAGGYNGGHTTDVQAYDAATNTWTQKGSRPTIQDSGPASGVVAGKIYTAGGTDCCVHISSLWSYDPAANTWSQLASMPGGARSQLSGAAVGNTVYAVGGYGTGCNNTYCNRLEGYTVGSGWATLAPISIARAGLAAAELNGLLYVVGGGNPAALSAADSYDPATNTWTQRAPMLTPRNGPAAVGLNGKLYVFGGSTGSGTSTVWLNSMEIYDPATNSWTAGAPMPTARASAMASAVNGAIYVIGGSDQTTINGKTEMYCP